MPFTKSELRTKIDHQAHVSVATSFNNEADLLRLGVTIVEIACPECGAKGKRIGGGNDPLLFKGFELKTLGGKKAVLAKCEVCLDTVTFSI